MKYQPIPACRIHDKNDAILIEQAQSPKFMSKSQTTEDLKGEESIEARKSHHP